MTSIPDFNKVSSSEPAQTSQTNHNKTSSPTKKDTEFTVQDGRLLEAEWLASPNWNARPKDAPIDTIVIHNISLPPSEFRQYDRHGMHYVKAFFTNQLDWDAHPYFQTIKGMEVSAHLFIERDGSVTQLVNFANRAWHAGKSSYLGREQVNDFSIGIELEGSDHSAFSNEQYAALAQVVAALHTAYPATRRHVTGHSDIAPIRKTDPGEYFDWQQFRQRLAWYLSDNR